MTTVSRAITNFEDLSDEILISIIEYLSLEEFILIFEKLNTRFAFIAFDHPWTHHQLNIQQMSDETLERKLDFIQNRKLTSRISSLAIQPFSIYHSIATFNQRNSIANFVNLHALSLSHVTLDEAESIFTTQCLSSLNHLVRLRVTFSLGMEETDYSLRVERLVSQMLIQPSLQYCTLHTAQPLEFSQIRSPSHIEHLDIDCCSFQSFYTLFKLTPSLRRLSAAIAVTNGTINEQISTPPLLTSLKLTLSAPCFDELTTFLKQCPELQKLNINTHSVIEPAIYTSSWLKLITQHLPLLNKFKRESNVALENIGTHVESFHWPNGWHLEEKSVPNGTNYARMTLVNTRY